MNAKPKRKRKRKLLLASKYDRAVAELIATGLRQRLGPNDPAPADAVVVPIDHVLSWLDHFAKHGTFDLDASRPQREREARHLWIRGRYLWLRAQGETYQGAVGILAEEFDCSESTVCSSIPSGYFKKGAPVLK